MMKNHPTYLQGKTDPILGKEKPLFQIFLDTKETMNMEVMSVV